MKRLTSILIPILLLMLLPCASVSLAATTAVSFAAMSVVSLPTMTAYCQAPPIKTAVSPNVLLNVDVSGSMAYAAYSYGDTDANGDGMLDKYNAALQYEGYFDPSKFYAPDASGIYQEYNGGAACHTTTCNTWKCSSSNTGGCSAKGTNGCSSSKYSCCTNWNMAGDCNQFSGNYLNYALMHRIDLLRWAMTGGRPSSCTVSPGDGAYCDPEAWADTGNSTSGKVGTVCNNSLDVDGDGIAEGGCILWLDSGDKVKVRWERITGANLVTGVTGSSYGLVYQLAQLPVIPRIGVDFFSDAGVRANKVYLGDFTSVSSLKKYPYYNMIAAVNAEDPNGGTPTGPAMWDAYNYFAQKAPQYGGFSPQAGKTDTSNQWKNPMYQCGNSNTNCLFIPCTDNYVILLSDGQWNTPSCSIDPVSPNSSDPVVPAYLMHKGMLNTASTVSTSVRGVYTIGLFLGGSGDLAMKNIAMYGSFDKTTKTWPDSRTDYPKSTCTADDCSGTAKGSSCTALPASSPDWDTDGDNLPDTYYNSSNAQEIKQALLDAMLGILARTTAGTAASVLASREGSGANLLQAVYYPKRPFPNATIDWVGNLQNLWYYIDPALQNSNMREDGRDSAGNHDFIMTLKTLGQVQKDYITVFRFDPGSQAAVADRWADDNGDSSIVGETQQPTIKVDQVANLWEAGYSLWLRNWTSRTVYTANVTATPTTNNLMAFSCAGFGSCPNAPVLKPYLNATDSSGALSDDVASTLMQWVLGTNSPSSGTYIPSYRSRQATVGASTQSWKLGDIVNSTPKVSTWLPLSDYNITYQKYESTYGPPGTVPYQSDPVNTSYYITAYKYKGRGMVYTGANDGMLHAFRLGLLQSKWSGQGAYEKAKLTNKVCSSNTGIFCSSDAQCPGGTCSGTVTLGDEAWAFIPKNALPYLKYLADKSYCHIYTVDLTPQIFDASIAKPSSCTQANYDDCNKALASWRTVLIGGMRLGGACRNPAETCTNCVKTPIWDPSNPKRGLGYSTYFALDITDQTNPVLMWEYDGTVKNSDGTYTNKLGLSFSGSAVVRINNRVKWPVLTDATQKNGKWFVVFGSGPTGPIDASYNQFLGKSDQNLTLHIFDLATGPGTDNNNVTILDTGRTNSFSGSIAVTTWDVNLDYSDDVIYVPYIGPGTDMSFTAGGLGRVLIKGTDPSAWTWSLVLQNAGPITAAPTMFKSNSTGDLWLLFGTGRYFFDTVSSTDDADPAKRRQLFGMKETCLNAAKNGFLSSCPAPAVFCDTPVSSTTCGGLTNVDDLSVSTGLENNRSFVTSSAYTGWYIDLEPALPVGAPTLWGERMLTNATPNPSGIVFYTTFKPQNDPCSKGGQTYIWATKYDTGGSAAGLVSGTAIIQLSTGTIEQKNLKDIFSPDGSGSGGSGSGGGGYGGRRSAGMIGQPPTGQGLTVIPGAQGVSKPLFMKER